MRSGAIIAGTWLIGLGIVFLIQQQTGLPWGRAWPLFLILAGAAIGVSSMVGMRGRRFAPWTLAWELVWPLAMIAVGVLLFVDLAGIVEVDSLDLLARWWPAGLIALGALLLVGAVWPRGRAVEERLSVPLAGATEGSVTMRFGAGRLEVGRGTPGVLVDGTFEGGVIARDRGAGRIELEADAAQLWPWVGQRLHWRVGLAPDVPLRLKLEGGASRSEIDLADLDVRSLNVSTGASDTRVTLPRAAARCEVKVEAGAAQVTIDVPAGVAARIRSSMALGSTTVDERRFPRAGEGWVSPDFETAAARAEIEISGGVGSARVG